MAKKQLTFDKFIKLIDNHHDEINIWDNNYKLLYINNACERHYGLKKEEMIGRNYFEFIDAQYWSPTLLPYVYKEKKPLMASQQTHLGTTITSIVIPYFNEDDEIQYVLSSVRDEVDDIYYLNVNDVERKECEERDISLNSILYKSDSMENIMNLAYTLANVDSPVVILGESGVGKTLLAKVMHSSSSRKDKPFININCGAIPKELIESELFGYKEGAFTGASKQGKDGLFSAADGGTLLLDEITELPLLLQSKLLQVVQDNEFIPIGSNEMKKVDVKIIAATNKNLKKLVDVGSFREDLYYRLSVFEIDIPPLRERKDDIEMLALYYLNKYNKKYKKPHHLSSAALEVIKNYSWRGNVRELSHIIERLVVINKEYVIKPQHLPNHFYEIRGIATFSNSNGKSFDDAVDEFKRKIVTDAYDKYGSTRKIAKELNISQSKASRLVRKYIGDIENLE